MNFNQMSDSDLSHYFLNTDFENTNLTASEYKFILDKIKSFHKIKIINNVNLSETIKQLRISLEKEKALSKKMLEELKVNNDNHTKEVEKIVTRKLTLMERITGKIKYTTNDK